MRERVSDLAARVMHLTAEDEGPDSPLYEILGPEPDKPAAEGAEGRPSLAERVRRLRQQNLTKDQAAE